MKMLRCCLVLVILWLSMTPIPVAEAETPVPPGPPYLVTQTNWHDGDANPQQITELNGVLYFVADDGVSGAELWRTDGTWQNTWQVANIRPEEPGGPPLSSEIAQLSALNGRIIFGAHNGQDAYLYAYDPDLDLLTPILQGAFSADNRPAVLDDTLYLFSYINNELWKTRGTPETTELVANFYRDQFDMLVFGGQLIISAQEVGPGGDVGHELWTSDGTSQGTLLLKDINAVPTGDGEKTSDSSPMYLTEAGGMLYFNADDGVTGREPWTTNGTEEGTYLVEDLCPGSCSSSPSVFTPYASETAFVANDGVNWRIWATDGQPETVRQVTDLEPTYGYNQPFRLIGVGDDLYTVVMNPEDWRGHLYVVHHSDESQPQMIIGKDISIDSVSQSDVLMKLGNRILFYGYSSSYGETFLFSTDGDPSGAVLLDWVSSYSSNAKEWNGSLYFAGTHYYQGVELWRSDGSPEGTGMVANIHYRAVYPYNRLVLPDQIAAGQGKMFFDPDEGETQRGMWVTDGSEGGTGYVNAWDLCEEIYNNRGNSNKSRFAILNGEVFYIGVYCYSIRKWDGISDQSQLVVTNLSLTQNGGYLTTLGQRVYFFATSTQPLSLWSTDGTPSGTAPVKSVVPPGNIETSVSGVAVGGNLLYFFTHRPNSMAGDLWWKLWRSDGTPQGTFVLLEGVEQPDIYTWDEMPAPLTAGALTYFSIPTDGQGKFALYQTDGSLSGTRRVAPGLETNFLQAPTPVGDKIYFFAQKEYKGTLDLDYSLYRTDGPQGGISKVIDFQTGMCPFMQRMDFPPLWKFAEYSGRLYFSLTPCDNLGGGRLWVSDGTAGGTHEVFALGEGPENIYGLISQAGRLFFAADDGVHGIEPWISDGTPQGSHMLADIYPGAKSSDAGYFTFTGKRLVFFANDGITGYEPWAYDFLTGRVYLPTIAK